MQTARANGVVRHSCAVETCPINLLEFKPLCNEYTDCSSMLKGIRAKCNRATAYVGYQGRNLKVVKLRPRSPCMITGLTLESPAASSCPGHLFTILERVHRLGMTITRRFLPDLRYRTREQMCVGHRTCDQRQPRDGLGGVYGLMVVPMSIEKRIFSSPWYLSLGGHP